MYFLYSENSNAYTKNFMYTRNSEKLTWKNLTNKKKNLTITGKPIYIK